MLDHGTGEVFIDFTNEDLLVIVELLGIDPPPGVGVGSLDELAIGGNVERLREAALGSLRARGIVTERDGVDRVADAVQQVIGAFANPGAMVAAAFEAGGILETRFYAALPEIAIEHRGLSISLHRFIPFASRDLLARVLHFVDLRPYSPEAPVTFSTDEKVLQQVAEHIEQQDRAAAVRALTGSGVEAATADRFVGALGMKRTTGSVTILHRPDQETVAGGSLSWLDAGLAGLWVTEIDPSAEDKVELKLLDARSLAAELLSFLPDAFGDHGLAF